MTEHGGVSGRTAPTGHEAPLTSDSRYFLGTALQAEAVAGAPPAPPGSPAPQGRAGAPTAASCCSSSLPSPPPRVSCTLIRGLLVRSPELTQHVLRDENDTGGSQGRPQLCPLGLSCLRGQRAEAQEVPSRPGPQRPASMLGSPLVQKGPCARGLGEGSGRAWKGPEPRPWLRLARPVT